MFAFLLLLLSVKYIDSASSLGFRNGSNVDRVTLCINKEREALLSFKAGLIGEYSSTLSTWSSEEINKDCCNWSGVECSNKTGHVIKLRYNGMRGNISTSLLELRELNYLDLRLNNFEYKPIPEFFGSFTKLQYLYLSYSSFSGTIPSQLGNLSNLNTLDLSGFVGSIKSLDWLSHLSSLKYFTMMRADLSRATNWLDVIKSLPSLSYLNLALSQLSLVSPSLSFTNYSSPMKTLDLAYNMLKGPIPDSFGNNMTSLEILDLSGNLLEGMIPKSFRNLCNLQEIDLYDNSLSGNFSDFVDNLPAGCPKATRLEKLSVNGNKLFGPLPHGIKNFSSLRRLEIGGNKLNETLTTNLGTLSKLEILDLSFNSLSVVVTEAHFSSLSNLIALGMSSNSRLVFNLSSQWVPPFRLLEIKLRSCNLGPSFPQWIRIQQGIEDLDVSNNSISENISAWILNQTNYMYLNLSSNSIGGTLPDLSLYYVGVNPTVGPIIDLSSNNFEGPLPLFPSRSQSLYLSKNNFSGTLSFLCQLDEAALNFLDISHNFLTGKIPDCLGEQYKLNVLDLAHNNLSGEIPASVVTLYNLQTLNLYNNSFSGEFPLSLSNCIGLRFLDIGVNKLSGNVPAWIGRNLSQLYILSLRSNNFVGTIPIELCSLNVLRVLDLSLNNLRGTIPPCLNNLSSMAQKGLLPIDNSYLVPVGAGIIRRLGHFVSFADRSVIQWQGRELEFGKNLRYLKSIDLSSNNLTGEFPNEITELFELDALNLSRNGLHGKVPQQIGRLNSLLSLDLSRNNLSGHIPATLSQLNSLNYLDLSYNNFSGKIPSGTQLQSFNASNYIGNVGLCGPPLPSSCPGDEPSPPTATIVEAKELDSDNEYKKWLYIGMCMGFVTAFWGTCGALLLNSRGRRAFFVFVDGLYDWLYVKIATKLAR